MGIFEELQHEMQAVEENADHNGYWYSISETLTLLICGMLCRQQRIDDIRIF